MYISEWELEEDETYYQATMSIEKDLTPFLKLRIIPLPAQRKYNLVIRDYNNANIMLSNTSIKMEQGDDGVYTNWNTAKKTIENMTRIYLIGFIRYDMK